MSTDLSIVDFSQPTTLPAHLQGANLGVSSALLATAGQGGNRIGLKGSRFRLVVNGKEEHVIDANYLDVIVLGAVPSVSRIYYEGKYDSNTKAAPTCYSEDGVRPAEDVKNKQADKCDLCPMNQKGSKIVDGNKIKACSYFQRLVVMLAGDSEGIKYKLDVKSQGIFGDSQSSEHKYNLRDYTKFVANRGVDVGALVTRVSFDTDSSVPKLLFSPNRFITEDEYSTAAASIAGDEVKQLLRISMATVDLSHETDDAPTGAAEVVTPAAMPATAKPVAEKPTAKTVVEKVAVPAEPAPKVMTAKAEFSYDEYVAAGWDDAGLIGEGLLEAPPKPKPAPPAPKAAAPAPKAAAPAPKAAPKPAAPAPKAAVVQETTTDAELASLLASLE